MGVNVAFTGTATIGTTEYSLPNGANYSAGAVKTTGIVAQLWLGLANLANGDEYELKLYEKVDGGTVGVAESWSFKDAQAKPNTTLPAVMLKEGWDFTMTKIAGTDRSISWSIREPA